MTENESKRQSLLKWTGLSLRPDSDRPNSVFNVLLKEPLMFISCILFPVQCCIDSVFSPLRLKLKKNKTIIFDP